MNNKRAAILREWDSLRRTMWKQRCVVSPYRFLHFVREGEKTKEVTNNFEQQDPWHNKGKVFPYLVQNRLKSLLENVEEFIS